MHGKTVIAAFAIAAMSACAPSPSGDLDRPSGADQTSRGAVLASTCSGCHIASGDGAGIPSIHGDLAPKTADALRRYRSEASGTTVMHRLARGYTIEDIDLIAEYLAAQSGD